MTTEVLTVIGVGAVVVAYWFVRARFFPYGRCAVCRGRRGRGVGSTGGSWSHCPRCGGSGEVIRLSARVWPRWRRQSR